MRHSNTNYYAREAETSRDTTGETQRDPNNSESGIFVRLANIYLYSRRYTGQRRRSYLYLSVCDST